MPTIADTDNNNNSVVATAAAIKRTKSLKKKLITLEHKTNRLLEQN